jgi:peptidyl-prolyl cis-trans isomerase A (cyclophilin A)
MRTTPMATFGLVLALAVTASSAAPAAGPAKEKLMNPATLNEKSPDVFRVKLETSKGDVVVEVTRAWAPNGADRFFNLVKNGYYDDVRFFRVLREPRPFMAQFGVHGDPAVAPVWRGARIADDPVKESNKRGTLTFATAGPNTRTTQLFINYGDNTFLDGQGFSPFGKVAEGMEVVDSFYAVYGEGAPRGNGPDQNKLQNEGNAYLNEKFPKLDFIKKAYLLKGEAKKAAAEKAAGTKPEAKP